MLRIAGMALLAAACAAAPGFAGEQAAKTAGTSADAFAMEEVLTMRVDGTIAVDATGQVLRYEVATKLDPAVQSVIDKAVPNWLFLPPEVDGKPAAVKSDMRITLIGRKVEAGYEIRIENVLFSKSNEPAWLTGNKSEPDRKSEAAKAGEALYIASAKPMPQFPRYDINGMVTIMVKIAPNGRVGEAIGTQCSLYHASGTAKQLQDACKAMEKASTTAIRRWKFAGSALAESPSATIPLWFSMHGRGQDIVVKASAPGNWRQESRTPYRAPAWLGPEERFVQRMGTSDAVGGELMPAASPLRWRDGAPNGGA